MGKGGHGDRPGAGGFFFINVIISAVLLLFTLYILYWCVLMCFYLLLKSYTLAARNVSSPIVFDLDAIMENWNQDHPERYSNFYGLYIKFQGCGKWPWTW